MLELRADFMWPLGLMFKSRKGHCVCSIEKRGEGYVARWGGGHRPHGYRVFSCNQRKGGFISF